MPNDRKCLKWAPVRDKHRSFDTYTGALQQTKTKRNWNKSLNIKMWTNISRVSPPPDTSKHCNVPKNDFRVTIDFTPFSYQIDALWHPITRQRYQYGLLCRLANSNLMCGESAFHSTTSSNSQILTRPPSSSHILLFFIWVAPQIASSSFSMPFYAPLSTFQPNSSLQASRYISLKRME